MTIFLKYINDFVYTDEIMAKQQSSMGFFLLLMLSLLILFDPNIRAALGNAVGVIFFPIFGFNYKYPVLTIFLAGSIVIIISALLRHFTTNWVEMAKMQHVVAEFQKKYREAMRSKNKHIMKKMQKMQMEIMKMQSEISSKQMRLMPITLLIFVPVFTWIWDFLMSPQLHHYFDTPWHLHVSFFDNPILFPNWILLYMLLSIPLTQIIQYLLRLKWIKEQSL